MDCGYWILDCGFLDFGLLIFLEGKIQNPKKTIWILDFGFHQNPKSKLNVENPNLSGALFHGATALCAFLLRRDAPCIPMQPCGYPCVLAPPPGREKMLSRNHWPCEQDTLAEWLRRRPAKPMGSARVGSNPIGVVGCPCNSFSIYMHQRNPDCTVLFCDMRSGSGRCGAALRVCAVPAVLSSASPLQGTLR